MCFNNNSDIEEINSNACARSALVFFRQGEKLLCEMKPNSVKFLLYYIAPCTVELALACELYLKAIIATENNGIIRKGHSINKLYKQLSKKRKDCIIARYSSYIDDHPEIKSLTDIKQCLRIHNDAFIKWRYYYEKGKQPSVEVSSLYFLALSLHEEYERVSGCLE